MAAGGPGTVKSRNNAYVCGGFNGEPCGAKFLATSVRTATPMCPECKDRYNRVRDAQNRANAAERRRQQKHAASPA